MLGGRDELVGVWCWACYILGTLDLDVSEGKARRNRDVDVALPHFIPDATKLGTLWSLALLQAYGFTDICVSKLLAPRIQSRFSSKVFSL